jgi:Tfp pilus assembly protein PilP
MRRAASLSWTLIALLAAPAAAVETLPEPPTAPAGMAQAPLEPAPSDGVPGAAEPTDEEGRRRDPFRPFTLDLRPKDQDEPLTPLQTYELRQLTVAAVMYDMSPPLAMLEDEVGMGFIVSPGTLIGRAHGVVTAIEAGRVIVEEKVLDFYGREQVNRVVLEMPKEDEPKTGGRETR